MDIPTQTELLERIESFCTRHAMAETRFGRDAVNNPAFIRGLRDGKSPTLETLNRLKDFMADADAAAATRAKLDAPLDPPPPGEEELALPFLRAPVNPTGASSPTSSPTSAPSTSPPARNSSRCSTTAARSSSAAEVAK